MHRDNFDEVEQQQLFDALAIAIDAVKTSAQLVHALDFGRLGHALNLFIHHVRRVARGFLSVKEVPGMIGGDRPIKSSISCCFSHRLHWQAPAAATPDMWESSNQSTCKSPSLAYRSANKMTGVATAD